MDIFFTLSQIDKLCRKHHMTKAEFYEKVGVTASAVSQWRNGKTEPAETTIHRIADLFNVDVNFLTRAQKNPDPQMGAGMDGITKEILDELDGLTEAELLLVKERIRKIKESRE
jgi:transcriptional regulator with XRE-family HTH domain